jgi:hypothetical protein
MNRLLKIVDSWYGEGIRRRVFEPLVADFDNDVRGNRSLLPRLRWWSAVITTFVVCIPRVTFGNLPRAFVLDAAGRALAFFVVAFALQWLFGWRQHNAPSWPPSFATTFFFIITPVIWRLRYEAIPIHQQRLLAIVFAAACVAAAWATAEPSLALGAAMLLSTAWLTISSWRAFTALTRHDAPIRPWLAGFYPVVAIVIAGAVIKVALGIPLWRPWWPGDNAITLIVGNLMTLTAKSIDYDAPYRKFLK